MKEVISSVRVDAPISEVFALWADFENFPHFMNNIREVRKTGGNASHWRMRGMLGRDIQWDAQTTQLEPDRVIAWESTGGDIATSGRATFEAISPEQTEVTVALQYSSPLGDIGSTIAEILIGPQQQIEEDLANFKRFAESRHAQAA